jgi:hypothetical protein
MLPQFVRPTPRPGEVPQSAVSRLPHRRDYAHCPPDQCECLTAGPFGAGAAFPGTRHFCIHVTWPKLLGSARAEYVPKRPLLSVVVQVKADSWAPPKPAPKCRGADQPGMHSHRRYGSWLENRAIPIPLCVKWDRWSSCEPVMCGYFLADVTGGRWFLVREWLGRRVGDLGCEPAALATESFPACPPGLPLRPLNVSSRSWRCVDPGSLSTDHPITGRQAACLRSSYGARLSADPARWVIRTDTTAWLMPTCVVVRDRRL